MLISDNTILFLTYKLIIWRQTQFNGFIDWNLLIETFCVIFHIPKDTKNVTEALLYPWLYATPVILGWDSGSGSGYVCACVIQRIRSKMYLTTV